MTTARTGTKLQALLTQGKALMSRGNVSMEEVDAYIGLSDAVLAGEVPATISANTAITSDDPDVKLELAVTEVAAMSEANNGQIPPPGSVVSMDDDEAADYDALIDESEELTALSDFGTALNDSGLDNDVPAMEQYRKLVIGSFKRNSVSLEDISIVEGAVDIDGIVAKVDDVRDVADAVIEDFSNSGNVIVSEESINGTQPLFNHVRDRARRHIAKKGAL